MNKDTKVYKYRGSDDEEIFERDLLSLENNYFWAPTKDDLNDPCEGLFERKNVDNQFKLIEKVFAKEKSLNGVKEAFDNILKLSNTAHSKNKCN